MMTRRHLLTLAALSGLVALAGSTASPGAGGNYDLSWHTIDTGGETSSTGGDFVLAATIGQPDAGSAMTGGDYVITGGFWAGIIAPTTPPTCPIVAA